MNVKCLQQDLEQNIGKNVICYHRYPPRHHHFIVNNETSMKLLQGKCRTIEKIQSLCSFNKNMRFTMPKVDTG